MVNNTLNYLYARAPISTLCFSGSVTTASIYLNGPGGKSGDGFPMPRDGYITGLHVWDGSANHVDEDRIAFGAGDRLSIYCQSTGSDFTVRVRINGSSSGMEVASVPFNTSLFATIELMLMRA